MIEINLLPWREHLKTKKRVQQGMEILGACLFSVIVLICLHFILDSQLKKQRVSLAQREASLDKVNKSLEAVRRLYQKLDYQTLPSMDGSRILNYQRQLLHFLKKITEWLPRNLRLQQLKVDEQTWILKGVSPALADILHFVERFNNNLQAGENNTTGKENHLKIMKKNNLFYYQLRVEFNA